jgi:hypothetical protein
MFNLTFYVPAKVTTVQFFSPKTTRAESFEIYKIETKLRKDLFCIIAIKTPLKIDNFVIFPLKSSLKIFFLILELKFSARAVLGKKLIYIFIKFCGQNIVVICRHIVDISWTYRS